MGLKSDQLLDGYLHKLCATTSLTNLASRMSSLIQGFVVRLVFMFLLLHHPEYISTPKTLDVQGKALQTLALLLHIQ